MRFTIRDLLWLTVVVALGVAWLVQRVELGAAETKAIRSGDRLEWLVEHLADKGYRVDWDSDPFGWWIEPSVPSVPKNEAPAPIPPKD